MIPSRSKGRVEDREKKAVLVIELEDAPEGPQEGSWVLESLEEQALLLALDFTGKVEDVLPQPFTLRFEIPGGELWVHCQAGYRAAVAASLLQAAHRQVIAIDDEFGHAGEAGLPVVSEPVRTSTVPL